MKQLSSTECENINSTAVDYAELGELGQASQVYSQYWQQCRHYDNFVTNYAVLLDVMGEREAALKLAREFYVAQGDSIVYFILGDSR